MTTTLQNTMDIDMKVYELLFAKFCHDIAGPVGAVGNGFEMMQDEKMRDAAFELASSSASRLSYYLTFYRQAYGYVAHESDVNLYTVKALIDNFLNGTNVKFIILKESKGDSIDGRVAKLIYNLVLMSSTIMLYDGDLKILLKEDAIEVTSTATIHKISKDLEANLYHSTDHANVTISNVQIVFTSLIAKDLGYKIKMDASSPEVVVFTLNKMHQ